MASLAKPFPCAQAANAQPISGVPSNGGVSSRLKSARPMSPMYRPLVFSSMAQ